MQELRPPEPEVARNGQISSTRTTIHLFDLLLGMFFAVTLKQSQNGWQYHRHILCCASSSASLNSNPPMKQEVSHFFSYCLWGEVSLLNLHSVQ
jgi:hypothetical protein